MKMFLKPINSTNLDQFENGWTLRSPTGAMLMKRDNKWIAYDSTGQIYTTDLNDLKLINEFWEAIQYL